MLLLLNCSSGRNNNSIENLLIGKSIDDLNVAATSGRILTNSSQLAEHYIISIDGVDYDLGVSTNNIINYISTKDLDFKTNEGLRVGDYYEKVIQFAKPHTIVYESGWGNYIKLNNDWYAFFEVKDFGNLKNEKLEGKKVISFFQK